MQSVWMSIRFLHRLRHNVIKTGVRMISLSYSRISLSDIAKKLLLDSAEDAEFIVSKVSSIQVYLVFKRNWHTLDHFFRVIENKTHGV